MATKTDGGEMRKGYFVLPSLTISTAGPLYAAVGHRHPKYTPSHRLVLQSRTPAPGTSDGCRHQRDARCSLDK